MIEPLLQAERALASGLLDQAEGLFAATLQADPRNAIAVVGLARVAVERGDDGKGLHLGRRALAIDPENPTAQRLVGRLTEVAAYRAGQTPPEPPLEPTPTPTPEPEALAPLAPLAPLPAVRPVPHRRSLLDRLLGRR